MQKHTGALNACYVTINVTNLQVWAIVFGDKGTVTLAQHRDLLLNVFDLILCLLQIYDLDGHHFLCAIIDAFEHLTEWTFANALQLGEQLLWVSFGILDVVEKWTKQGRKGNANLTKIKEQKQKRNVWTELSVGE